MSIAMSDLNKLTSDVADGDLEIEDVSFLPGGGTSASKRAVYEPSGVQKCHQIVCSKARAVFIVSILVVFAVVIAVIAAFARPAQENRCSYNTSLTTTELPAIIDTDPVATNGAAFPWKSIRLPDSILPVTYSLLLHPNLTTFTFTGDVTILMEVKEATNFIVFHNRNLTLSAYDLFDSGNEKVDIVSDMETVGHQQVYLGLAEKLQAGHTYKLRIRYNGLLTDAVTGFYRSSYEDKNGDKRWIATSHFEPTDARAAFPCFDEPQLKANFTISLVREQAYVALSNMDVASTRPYNAGSGLVVDEFYTSVKMSTYLVAFIVCDYKNLTSYTPTNHIRVSVFSPPTMFNQTQYALKVATEVLDFYENECFKIPYPLTKSDQIAIPDFPAGAMENWGLITYLLRSLLYKEGVSSIEDKQWVATVVAHELAHQWFGNLVTMEWWNDLWLNEGFANFMQYKGTNYAEPTWKMMDQFLDEALISGLSSDGLRSSHPISVVVNDPTEINQIFDSISYRKGSSVIRMLEAFLGEETFMRGIRHYLTSHKYGNAKTEDLWAALSEKLGEDDDQVNLTNVMDTWTRQMGYPVVMVTRNGPSFTVSQERFLFNPRSSNQSEEFASPYGYKWYIPLTYVTSDDPKQHLKWMDKGSLTFDVEGDPTWVKFNADMTGFYRVAYDTQMWQTLTSLLLTDHTIFSTADRTSLLEDVFNLARSGHVEVTMALDLSRYLKRETEYIPLKIGLEGLSYIGQMLEYTSAYSQYKIYMLDLLSEQLRDIDWTTQTSPLAVRMRSLVLGRALHLGEKPVILRAREQFNDWKKGSGIPADMRNLVYTAGVRYGGEEEWNFVWEKFCDTNVPTDKTKLLRALTTSNDVHLLDRLLKESLRGKEIRQKDITFVITLVSKNPTGSLLAWHFARNHWATLYTKFHGQIFGMGRLIYGTTGHFTTKSDYEEVKGFLESENSGGDTRAVSQTLESIEMNMDWIRRNQDKASLWFHQQVNTSSS